MNFTLLILNLVLFANLSAHAAADWMQNHIGGDQNQIAPIVYERARAWYTEKAKQGKIHNTCFLAVDATKPGKIAEGIAAPRMYVICDKVQTFQATSAGMGSGRKFPDFDLTNSHRCSKNFSNAVGSHLSMGGKYTTADFAPSFKGMYVNQSFGKEIELHRPFFEMDGEGESETGRDREIGIHAAESITNICYKHLADHPMADHDGFVPFGTHEVFPEGQSLGCIMWNPKISDSIQSLLNSNPTTLYVYPEASPIAAKDLSIDC